MRRRWTRAEEATPETAGRKVGGGGGGSGGRCRC